MEGPTISGAPWWDHRNTLVSVLVNCLGRDEGGVSRGEKAGNTWEGRDSTRSWEILRGGVRPGRGRLRLEPITTCRRLIPRGEQTGGSWGSFQPPFWAGKGQVCSPGALPSAWPWCWARMLSRKQRRLLLPPQRSGCSAAAMSPVLISTTGR